MLAFSRYRKQVSRFQALVEKFTTPCANNEHLFPLQRNNRVYWDLLLEKSVGKKAERL